MNAARSLVHRVLIVLLLPLVLVSIANAAKPGDPTLGQQATQALTDRDYDVAVSLFERWLEADPNQAVDWYNFSCALALRGENGRAIEALHHAMAAGYHNREWTSKDPDLESLHEIPGFTQILDEMALRADDENAARAGRRHLAQARLGTYLLRLPEHQPESGLCPLVVLLHGRGGHPDRFITMAERLGLPGVIYAAPQAAYPVPGMQDGFQYWPEELRGDTSAPEAVLASHLYAQWLREMIDEIARGEPVDTTKIFLIGFSQGAAMTYVAALEHPGIYAGIAPLGGWIPDSHRDPARMKALADHHVSLFIGHGEGDGAVQPEAAEAARRLASEAGVDHRLMIYSVGHEIPDPMVADLRAWIGEVCGRRP
ncbi:dienelactone hydrolase family protein [Candidatus Fermentibacteria bacterium]|nr:dienelactone hydrolase family protein [Candidatus Fermentibacteria bacterium]